MRTAHNNAELIVRGTKTQMISVVMFLQQMMNQRMIDTCFQLHKIPPMMPISQNFVISRSVSKFVITGEYSDKKTG